MRILIVEDEGKIRSGLALLIRLHTPNQVVGEAKNGKEGLELLRSLKPDLVITDIKMPEMDGLQMLETLHDLGVRQHAVILSGYTEFAYAQKALRIGADDYLLKPLTAEDVVGLLERMSAKIDQENSAWLEGMSHILRQALMQRDGAMELPQALREELFHPRRCNVVFMGHVKAAGVVDNALFQQCLDACGEVESIKGFSFYYSDPHEPGCLLSGELDEDSLIAIFEQQFIRRYPLAAVWSAKPIRSDGDIGDAYRSLREQLLFGMVMDTAHVMTERSIAAYQYQELEYPQHIINALRKSICKNDFEGSKNHAQSFVKAMRAKRYHPGQIHGGYQRLCTMVTDTVREFDSELYQQLSKQDYQDRLGRAYTFDELELVLNELISQLGRADKRGDIRNYVIMKAMNYIRENYRRGMTLEELAQHFNLTPEYLGTLFNREVGVNFSAFIRDFRLSHAKRLLRSTDMRIYEIAAQVGYSDVKYFTRVFKEQEGVSPKEFRDRMQGAEL